MFDLSVSETVVFGPALLVHLVAAIAAVVQLRSRSRWGGSLLRPLALAAILLDTILLVLRGVSIRAVPLTGLFESLVVLALVFGVLYLLLSPAINQVWFGAVMVWLIFGIVVAAAFVAQPAARPHAVAATPWAIAHASAMILAAASVVFAAANSALYLLGSYRLKHKRIMQVLGRIPNMETLANMNRLAVRVGFVLLTLGLVSGLGLVWLLRTGIIAWLTDVKVVSIIVAWGLLGAILVLDRLGVLKLKGRAYMTLAAFGLVLFAVIGVTVAGVTQHKFSRSSPPAVSIMTT